MKNTRSLSVLAIKLLFLLNYIVAEHESYFSHGSGLVLIHAIVTKDVTRRGVAGMHPGKVAAKEEAAVLKGRSQSDRRA